jgi:hypothetical protein
VEPVEFADRGRAVRAFPRSREEARGFRTRSQDAEIPPLEGSHVYGFLLGVDREPRILSDSELAELGDPLAKHLLRQGIFPSTVAEVLDELDKQVAVVSIA